MDAIKLAVVTGGHGFDIVGFTDLFRELPGIDAYIQHVDDFAWSTEEVRDGYDAVLFFGMLKETPVDEGLAWYQGKPKGALEHLGEVEQGIIILHHAVLAYPQWPVWGDMVGIGGDRSFKYYPGQTLRVDVADGEHPITQGMAPWEMVDETYVMAEPGEGSRVLLTTAYPKSMRSIAWVREHKQARVYCFVSGHDDRTWANQGFRQALAQGICWAARWV